MAYIVDDNKFYDPVIRYEVHTMSAKLLWVHGDHATALKYFKQACFDIENLEQSDLAMLALWNIISACFDEGLALSGLCLDSFDILANLVRKQPGIVSDNYRTEIFSLHGSLSSEARKKLEQDNRELVNILAKQQQMINEQAQQLRTRNLVCCYIDTTGHMLLDIYAIALPRNWNFVNVKNTIVDRGSIMARITFRSN